jgi:hypothetical protein
MSRTDPNYGTPAIIQCCNCGHRSTTRGRALSATDLVNKTLVCTKCGTRQVVDLSQIIEHTYRETDGLTKRQAAAEERKSRARSMTKRRKEVLEAAAAKRALTIAMKSGKVLEFKRPAPRRSRRPTTSGEGAPPPAA